MKSGQEVQALPRWLIGKDSAYQCRRSRRHRWDCIRSTGKGNGNPLQYSCLENPITEESGSLQSTGSQRVRHDWAHKHARSPMTTSLYPSVDDYACGPHLRGRFPLMCHSHPKALRSTKSGTLMYIFCICHSVLNTVPGMQRLAIYSH